MRGLCVHACALVCAHMCVCESKRGKRNTSFPWNQIRRIISLHGKEDKATLVAFLP